MKLVAITVAFCPAAQLARCLIEYKKYRNIIPDKHVIALGHYPKDTEKNNRDIKMICESIGDIEVWDPQKNFGSAQTQTWVLRQLSDYDAYWNIDPDSGCRSRGWDIAQTAILEGDPDCIVVSCYSPLVDRLLKLRGQRLEIKEIRGIRYGIARQPTPFNLSLWRCNFIHQIGGVPQVGEMWGDTEAGIYHYASQMGKYHAYLMDHMEDESGKLMQDRQLLEFKDLNMRTAGPQQFVGRYDEYLAWKYPELLKINTLISGDTVFQ